MLIRKNDCPCIGRLLDVFVKLENYCYVSEVNLLFLTIVSWVNLLFLLLVDAGVHDKTTEK